MQEPGLTNHLDPLLQPLDTEVAYSAVPLSLKALSGVATDHALNFPAPRVEPLTYPGRRPEFAFTTNSLGDVLPMDATIDEKGELHFYINSKENGIWDADDLLEQAGATSMKDRIPIVTFGSNANPGQLVHKFSTVESLSEQDRTIIPTTKGTIRGASPVFAAKVGMFGYVFADLTTDDPESTTSVSINWLTPAQLERMTQTEPNYTLSEAGTVELEGTDAKLPAYLYLAQTGVLLDDQKQPIRLAEVPVENSRYTAMTQTEALEFVLGLAGSELDLAPEELSIEGLHRYIESRPSVGEKKSSVGARIQQILREQNREGSSDLLASLPADKVNITPLTLGELLPPSEQPQTTEAPSVKPLRKFR